MKFIQSFWSCKQRDLLRFSGGWLSPEYNLMSWALSCLQLSKYYPTVELYADSTSASLLIDTLKLPYHNVICELDKLDDYHPQLWALPKIYAYSKQESPFLHVDGDVFIYDYLDSELLKNGLIAQNEESATNFYENILKSLEINFTYFPREILLDRKSNGQIHAHNAGIFGGHDLDFFRSYTSEAFRFVKQNEENLSQINVSNFNIFFEQYLFYCMAKQKNKSVGVLIDKIIGDNEYSGLGEFSEVPYAKKYLHLLGDYKRNEKICTQMANRLRLDYPEYYYRIIQLFKKNNISLLKDYYWFESNSSKEKMLSRHYALQEQYLMNSELKLTANEIKPRTDANLIFYRVPLFEKVLEHLSVDKLPLISKKIEKSIYVNDIENFEMQLNKIVTKQFHAISKHHLYGRDLINAGNFEYIFREPKEILEKIIAYDNLSAVVHCDFDWTILDVSRTFVEYSAFFEQEPKHTNLLIIPECHRKGYSIAVVDSLDLLLFEMLQEPKTIAKLLDNLEPYFEPEDLRESKIEFERLIFGRIKKGIEDKSIKVIRS